MRHGFLLINKPVGPTSHDVVAMVRRTLGERSIGHLGTLDPAAEGLMVLAVGKKALKVVELFMDKEKQYEATVRFGAISTTYDREGALEEVQQKPGQKEPDFVDVNRTIQDQFIGSIQQVPPGHSAINIGGERAYRKMRQGQQVDMPARTVHITSCKILTYTYPDVILHVHCGSGTYIRSLAHDLGQQLRCGAYLAKLKRTHVDSWNIKDAKEPTAATWSDIIPLKDVLKNHTKLEISDDEYEHIRHGRTINHTVTLNDIAWNNGLPVAILQPKRSAPELAHPRKVL